jgi:PadR family transcriptional regulator PadR
MCNDHHGEHHAGRCPRTARMWGFVQPWLLLLLARKPAHGYELMEQLGRDEDTPAADPGLLYRTLRQFEEEGLVRSTWDTSSAGAARRVYELTDQGQEYLHAWAVNIRRTRERLDRFLAEYESHFSVGA